MDIQAIAYDVNGTLIEISTDEKMDQIFRTAGHFLTYQGIDLRRHHVRELYFQIMKEQRKSSWEMHPEFDAVAIWRKIIDDNMTDFTRGLPPEKLSQLPVFLAEMGRGVSRRRLRLYPHVRSVLRTLRAHFPLALVTDGQSAYARGELNQVGLLEYFDPIIVSGDHGFRKPDKRLFEYAVHGTGVPADKTMYVGDNSYRDIFGAHEAGLRTVLFRPGHRDKRQDECAPDFCIKDHRELLTILGLH
jgi:putative hydrolase of the HAD superfamily